MVDTGAISDDVQSISVNVALPWVVVTDSLVEILVLL